MHISRANKIYCLCGPQYTVYVRACLVNGVWYAIFMYNILEIPSNLIIFSKKVNSLQSLFSPKLISIGINGFE